MLPVLEDEALREDEQRRANACREQPADVRPDLKSYTVMGSAQFLPAVRAGALHGSFAAAYPTPHLNVDRASHQFVITPVNRAKQQRCIAGPGRFKLN